MMAWSYRPVVLMSVLYGRMIDMTGAKQVKGGQEICWVGAIGHFCCFACWTFVAFIYPEFIHACLSSGETIFRSSWNQETKLTSITTPL